MKNEGMILRNANRAQSFYDRTRPVAGVVFGISAILAALVVSVMVVKTAFGKEPVEGKTVCLSPDIMLDVSKGAMEPLSEGHYYTRDQIKSMLSILSEQSGVDFSDAVSDVYKWNRDTGADIAAMCALVAAEGKSSHGTGHWNFFTLTAGNGDISYGQGMWDARQEYPDVGSALVGGMERIRKSYWTKGQDSFYTMCFNEYGYPTGFADAGDITHSYLPWWDDQTYIKSGYKSEYAFPNRLARTTEALRDIVGK